MKVLTFVGVMLAALSAQADSPFPKIEIQTFETHSRIVVPVDPGVQTVWSSTASGFDLLLKDISLLDLGIPFGSEKSWVEGLDQTGDQRVGHITVAEEPAGVRIKGHWKYPGGDKAPADPAMVTFDYHNRIPPTYVVDFWQKAGPTLVEARKAEKRRRQLEALKVAQATAERRVRRRVASLKRQHDVADAGKYCKEPLGDERDVFVEFRPARQEIDFGRWFPVTTPDADYPYYEPKGDTEEDQYLKLALDLYRAGKLALAVRTAEFFNKEHPGSALSNEMKFMRANAMLKLGLGAEAERLLKELVVDAPGSPAALHAGTYMAVKAVRDKNSLGALESFLWLYKHYPNHRLAWVFQLGSAEAMFELRQTEKASKAYQWVVENAPDKAAQAEAALRIGDLFLDRGQYAQALAAYFKGLKYYGDQSDSVPTALVNRAETLYWLGQYDRAEQAFKEYLDKHSGHPSAWRAAFRLGEILGRKGGDDFREQSRGMFFQTINRFPFSPGATL
ncbi:MAG TPA: tetratricopeptide repeat protein, partial [Bdellovibrionota bacterium]|nr:tetratricopeptide repeat protein [Bdellovibrionota bacterium]